ncbi:MAG: CDP-alcohol phosphatidyltransferase family protein [Victivallaceae bacterium]|jgi:CDP-diacylglycerol--serine O-phosphatidyltransferase|nr:CDP-alcohol phosphatidyltransferase family protein [Victivallaceae bacterium]MDD4317660.1 CDP-alcohol phosphatidyltransferase family protein [Victivallaceae bacterium]NLK82936.1 hypothetical protein [Lentisphaerota bacterium]
MEKTKIQSFITENRWFKAVPNALTLCNSLCGFAALLYIIRAFRVSDYNAQALFISAWIILGAMIFDALDGFAARIFNAASMRGMEMDSLADMVTFGVAPAAIIAVMAHSIKDATGAYDAYVYAMSGIYVSCAALRLATYNVHAILKDKPGENFSGLPSPGAAAGICSVLIFFNSAELYERFSIQLAAYLPIYAALLGLLMVSKIPYLHVGKWIFSARRSNHHFLIMLIILVLIGIFKIYAFAALVNIYIFSAPALALYKLLRRSKTDKLPQN